MAPTAAATPVSVLTITVTGIRLPVQGDARYIISFNDGSAVEFGSKDGTAADSLQQMKDYAALVVADPDHAKQWAIDQWLAKNPNADNTAQILNKTLTIDPSAVSPIKFQ